MHAAVLEFVKAHRPDGPRHILDVGGRDVNGNPDDLFPASALWEVVDLYPGPRVTWVGDFLAYPEPSWFDLVLHLEVAEHTPDWRAHIAKAADIAPRLIFTAAGPNRAPHSAHDGGALRQGEHYENVQPDDLAELLADLYPRHIIDVTPDGADVRAVAWRPL